MAGAASGSRRTLPRASCFHSAMTLSTISVSAAPWITWISRISLKSASSTPNVSALAIMPNISIT